MQRRKTLALPVLLAAAYAGASRAQTVLAADATTAAAPGAAPKTAQSREARRTVNNDAVRETSVMMQRSGGSLLRATMAAAPDPNQAHIKDVSFFAVPEPEPRTIKKHDLITVIVREESDSSSKGTADTKREIDLEARVDELVRLRLGNFAIQGGAAGANPPSIKITGIRNFKGEGTLDRTDSLTARVTGEVVDVKPNGTFVVQARKHIQNDDEEQEFILTGTARAEDVNADNTVLSTQMFDLRLQKKTKGQVRDATRRTWLQQILTAVSPF